MSDTKPRDAEPDTDTVPVEKPKPKLVEIGEFIPNAYGWMEIARRIDWEAPLTAVHKTWDDYGFRPLFQAEDQPPEPAWVKRALAKSKIEEKPDVFLPWPYLNGDRKQRWRRI